MVHRGGVRLCRDGIRLATWRGTDSKLSLLLSEATMTVCLPPLAGTPHRFDSRFARPLQHPDAETPVLHTSCNTQMPRPQYRTHRKTMNLSTTRTCALSSPSPPLPSTSAAQRARISSLPLQRVTHPPVCTTWNHSWCLVTRWRILDFLAPGDSLGRGVLVLGKVLD